MNPAPEALILLPRVISKSNYLAGFWRWVALLAAQDYQQALNALHWPKGTTWTPEALKKRITTFFGGGAPWFVVIPNDRLIGVINDAATYQAPGSEGWGWFMAQIPLTTDPADPKNDEIPLMGLAISFFIRQSGQSYVMEFEIFHV